MAPKAPRFARRALCTTVAATLLATVLPGLARPAPHPSRPITIIVPFAAGGGTDVATQAVAALMASA